MRAKRSLGQNFLVDPNLQRKIVAALDLSRDDVLLEIGPGRGALTAHLAGRCRRLVLVELDDDLAADLSVRYAERPDIEVVHADFLAVDLAALFPEDESFRVVGNIPYHITAPILFKLLDRPRPADIVLMVQKEVGDRLTANPGTSAYGALSVGVRAIAECALLFGVPRTAFRPAPNVDSVVVRISPLRPPPLSPPQESRLRELTRAVFQWRRKQLQKTLRDHPDLSLPPALVTEIAQATGWDLTRRPETLAPEDFVHLAALVTGEAADP